MDTTVQYEEVIATARQIFANKTKDYGTSWRVYRTISVADQIYIKAFRIRNIQTLKMQKIEDNIQDEFRGIVNYAIIGLIQLEINNEEPEDLKWDVLEKLYNAQVEIAQQLMLSKNHDYGEVWRSMSQESFVDLSLAKILRIKEIIKNDGQTISSEGIAANFLDILNYAVFALILISEQARR